MSICVRFASNLPPFMNDVPEIVRAFYPYIIIDDSSPNLLDLTVELCDDYINAIAKSSLADKSQRYFIKKEDTILYKRLTKRFVKNFLYSLCSTLTGVSLPYGSLTGVRPTKLYYELLSQSKNPQKALVDEFFVAKNKAALIAEVAQNQAGIWQKDAKNVSIYVNIPFCPSRCRYCSFIATEVGRIKNRLPDYLRVLKAEIEGITQIVNRDRLNVRSIYIGGGTPTVLSATQLLDTFGQLSNYGCEFTIECGRPDSIDDKKLAAIAALNATRISINPQTFHDKTLAELGRNHTVEDFYRAYNQAKGYNFAINMDLIAGLMQESFDDFKHSVNSAIALNPSNITIHTLSIKRGASLKNEGMQKSTQGTASQMTDYAYDVLKQNGYHPYYMYRQKNMADNMENIGYCKQGMQCIYNVDYMEELSTILAAGAGAVSKLLNHKENRHERIANSKDLNDYLLFFWKKEK